MIFLKYISILGSTGSIGRQALDVIRNNQNYKVVGLSANNNIELLEEQAQEFKPNIIAVYNEEKAKILKHRLDGSDIEVVSGLEGLNRVATESSANIVLTSVVGMIGLIPTLKAIEHGKSIALANKETLVTAGKLVMNAAKDKGISIIPVDSEHSAIFQCLNTENEKEISKIILTASGGPFRGMNYDEIKDVTVKDALKHPNWSMGKKITIDSATMMNKGLEVIEAKWLFNIDIEKIDVVVHPQSIVHSMVEYVDGSIIAQLGITDMRIPIQYALTYPRRTSNNLEKLNLSRIGTLTFEKPNYKTFPCLALAYEAIKIGGTMPAVLNAANEVAVDMFLKEKIKFYDIPRIIEHTMEKHSIIKEATMDDILNSDKWARKIISKDFKG
ncbi:1-deoxy-D-xylulose-5-phosphate reductoisomerase [Caldisalinibacter kiritimatiensis]|uniref:1-deoxy-D-xylulose-5-phosphate reductoisomerase n=1 Tax=Caldisalinibacter kiritimatiensis TaxID=1304284 RepID=UPI00241861A3|nr:1-deoxy-D-xylulose-5-phosphate reductoisomerase [Caldisalinibacter kiritimatiensis]